MMTRTSILVAALLGCHAQAQGEPASGSSLTGTVTVAGKPVGKAEVLVVKGGKVVATAAATPTFALPAMTSCADVTLVARFAEPVGVVSVPAPASCKGAVTIDVPASQIVELSATIKPNVDWLDVRLTPLLAAVPPTIVLADGTSSGLQEALWSQRITAATFHVRLIAGTWRLAAYRELDGPSPTNMKLDAVTSSGKPAVAKLGGFELEISAATKVELALRPAHAE